MVATAMVIVACNNSTAAGDTTLDACEAIASCCAHPGKKMLSGCTEGGTVSTDQAVCQSVICAAQSANTMCGTGSMYYAGACPTTGTDGGS